jgi:hypothetical protein
MLYRDSRVCTKWMKSGCDDTTAWLNALVVCEDVIANTSNVVRKACEVVETKTGETRAFKSC